MMTAPNRRRVWLALLAPAVAGYAVLAARAWQADRPPGPPSAGELRLEARVLDVFGATPVNGLGLPDHPPGPIDRVLGRNRRAERTLETIGFPEGRNVARTVDACRAVPGGPPAEMRLAETPRFVDVAGRLGPPSGRSLGRSAPQNKAVTYLAYGRLDLMVREGLVIGVRVRAR